MFGKRARRILRSQEGFTLIEMMVVIILVAALAAIAVPLYTQYLQQARTAEATGMVGAIVASEKTYNVKNATFVNAADNATIKATLGVNLDDAKYFSYSVTGASATAGVVTATGLAAAGSDLSTKTITYDLSAKTWGGTAPAWAIPSNS